MEFLEEHGKWYVRITKLQIVLGYFELYIIQNLEVYGYLEKDMDQSEANLAKYLFFVIMVYISTSILYYFGTKEGKHSRFFSIGALFTTILIMLTSYLFGIYIENFSQYNELYGSIGGSFNFAFIYMVELQYIAFGLRTKCFVKSFKKESQCLIYQ